MRLFPRLILALKSKLVILILSVMILTFCLGVIIFQTTQVTVAVAKDGETETVKTHAETVEELLKEMGITVRKNDELSLGLNTPIEDGMKIAYKRAKHVRVTIDDETDDYYTTADTIDEFIEEENISLSKHDDISHDLDESVKNGLHLDVTKAFEVSIDDGGQKQDVWTTGGTVEELLEDQQIDIDKKLDKVHPSFDDEVTKDTEVTITYVDNKEVTDTEEIRFETEEKKDHSLEKGKEKIIEEGKNGTVERTYNVTLENGTEVDRQLVDEEVKEEPQNKVVAVGTKESDPEPKSEAQKPELEAKPVSTEADSDDQELQMTATAYTADCSNCNGVTATGINLKDNPNQKVIAVDPNVIPLGSKVWVEGYGEAIASDTGGAVSGKSIDVHVPTETDAKAFGTKKVSVKIIDE